MRPRPSRSPSARCSVSDRPRAETATLLLSGLAISALAGALTTLALALAPSPFAFYGFPPHKKGERIDFYRRIADAVPNLAATKNTGGGAQLAFRNTQTLVLINGRRAAYAPVLSSGGFQFVLEDRSGRESDFLVNNLNKFLEAARILAGGRFGNRERNGRRVGPCDRHRRHDTGVLSAEC